VGILSLAVPVAVYLWFIHRYGVNMVWGDSWSDINVIEHAHAGTLSLATLWAQHNENRVFFPKLIVVMLGDTTHFNTVIEEYVSAAMLIIATGLLILTHRRRRPSTPWFYYCPVAILMFSLVGGRPGFGGGNTLWGFQMAWYLVFAGPGCDLVPLGSAEPDLARTGWSDRGRSGRQLLLVAGTPDLAHWLGASLSPPPLLAHHGGLGHRRHRDRSHLFL
jgi:hypothetical protein